jgi:hypothetical protein
VPPAIEVKVAEDPGVLAQEGKLLARPGKDQVVYYPIRACLAPLAGLRENPDNS